MMPICRGVLMTVLAFAAHSVFAVAPIEHWQTANGAQVYFIAARELPIVDLRIVIAAGSARDGAMPGLARLTSALLKEGTAAMNGQAFAERLADLGAEFDTDVDRDTATIRLRSLSQADKVQPAVELLAAAITRPAFDPAVVDRERERQLVHIKDREQSLSERLADRVFAALYTGHPYATPVDGESDLVRALDAASLQAFHSQYYVGANTVVAMVGDLDRARARKLAALAIGALARGTPAPPLPEPPISAASRVVIGAESTQTHVALAQLGMRYADADFFPLLVANHALGGGTFASRLFAEIRERRGLSYGAYSQFLPMAATGPFVAQLSTKNEQADAALAAMREVVQRFVEAGPTAKEIEDAKSSLIGGFPLRIDSNAKKVEWLARIGFYRLPLDYLDTYQARVAGVSLETASAAVRRRITMDQLTTLVIGGAAAR